MITADQAVPELHIPHQPLLVGDNEVQDRGANKERCYHLEKEAIINTFQDALIALVQIMIMDL